MSLKERQNFSPFYFQAQLELFDVQYSVCCLRYLVMAITLKTMSNFVNSIQPKVHFFY